MTDNSRLISDALLKTDRDLYAAIDGGESWRAGVEVRGARVAKYRKYERGDHDANMTDQMRDMLRLVSDTAGLNEFNLNYCKIVVDKMAGRLEVSEISADNEAANEWLDETLTKNNWERLEGELIRGAIRDGDSYALIDPVTATWVAEPAYDGFSGVAAIYGRGKVLWACKLWSESNTANLAGEESSGVTMKLVVYQPDRITYWTGEQNASDVEPVEVDDKHEIAWPIDEIPLVSFANQRDNYVDYGESEIRVAMPPQNALNRTLHSMIMASELSAFKVYWSIGMEIDKDGIVPGGVVNLVLKDAGGNIVTEMSPEMAEFLKSVKVGEFNESDISNYTNQVKAIVQEISQVTQTPIYGVTAQGNLSGEALKQLEIGLIGKVNRFQRENTNAIQKLITLTAEIQNAFDATNGSAPAFETVSVKWRSPEIADVAVQLGAIGKLFMDFNTSLFPIEWYRGRVGGLLGMSQSKIAEEGEKATNQQSLALGAFLGTDGSVPII